MESSSATTSREPQDAGEAKQTKPEATQTYVIQRKVLEPMRAEAGETWEDVVTVHVPKRTQVKTILTEALRDLAIEPTEDDRYRVLDEGAAEPLKVRPKAQIAPEYEVVKA